MKLTPKNKEIIDSKNYKDLLYWWRFAPIGDRWFEGETGEYWSERMAKLREQGADHVQASKEIGWKR